MGANALRTVTDRFSLVDLHRKHTFQNGRNYLLDTVSKVINSPKTQESMKLGELYGYYGHGRREQHFNKTGSLRVPETSVIMVEGAPLIVDNVPSNRTVDISVSPDGIVTHTQEILDTPTGQIVDGMERSLAGGWSWATKGGEQGRNAFIQELAGFDYVTIPNFISLDRMALMTESAEDEESKIVQALVASGMKENAAVDVYQHFRTMRDGTALFEAAERATSAELNLMTLQGHMDAIETQLRGELNAAEKQLAEKDQVYRALLESAKSSRNERRRIVRDLADRLPFHISKEQKQALVSMETPQDVQVAFALFESVANSTVRDLPLTMNGYQPAPKASRATEVDDQGILEILPRSQVRK